MGLFKKLGTDLNKSESDHYLNIHFIEPDISYSLGYLKSAEILIQQVKNNSDVLVYPILFLYRHFLELQFKFFIQMGSPLLDMEPIKIDHHDLQYLWDKVRRIILQLSDRNYESSEIELINEIVKDYNSIDQKNETFRYPKNKKGNNTLNAPMSVNLTELSKIMQRITAYFASIYEAFHYIQAMKNEMESAYHREYENYC